MNATTVVRRIRAPRAAVYRARLDAEAVARWKVPDGMTARVHRFEAREGGSFRVSLTYDAPTETGKTTDRTDTYHDMKKRTIVTAMIAAAALAGPGSVNARGVERQMENTAASTPADSGYVEANRVRYYYEIHGEGEPLLLLHGGLGAIEMMGPVLSMLADGRQVIGVDLHGHGRTALGDRPIRYEDMGDDMAVILGELGYERVDVMGYSMGGAVGLRLAIQHPEFVRRLVVVSAGFARHGMFPELLPMQAAVGAGMAEEMEGTPMHATYMELAPHPEDFPRLLDRMGELMRRPFDWAEDVKTLDMPVMLVYGDSDMLRPEHIVEFYQLLGGGLRDAGWQREHMSPNRLAILPDLTHYEIFMAPELARTVLPFLDGESTPPEAQGGAATTPGPRKTDGRRLSRGVGKSV